MNDPRSNLEQRYQTTDPSRLSELPQQVEEEKKMKSNQEYIPAAVKLQDIQELSFELMWILFN
jgi:hypothetical protein